MKPGSPANNTIGVLWCTFVYNNIKFVLYDAYIPPSLNSKTTFIRSIMLGSLIRNIFKTSCLYFTEISLKDIVVMLSNIPGLQQRY